MHIVIWLLIAATLSRCTLPAVTRDISDIERILHKRNAAVLEQAQLSSPGTSLQLIEKDHDDSIYLASYQVRDRVNCLAQRFLCLPAWTYNAATLAVDN